MKRYLTLLLFVTALSCKKEPAYTTEELLSRSWKMTGRTILTSFKGTPLEGTSPDRYSPQGCYSAMLWTYITNGDFLHEAGAGCVVDKSWRGKWELVDNNTSIKVDYVQGGFPDFEFKIIELTSTKMVVQRIETTQIGGPAPNMIIDFLNHYEFMPR